MPVTQQIEMSHVERKSPFPEEFVRLNPAFVSNDEGYLNMSSQSQTNAEQSSKTGTSDTDNVSLMFYETKDPTWVIWGQKLMKLIVIIICGFLISAAASLSVLCFQLAVRGLSATNKNLTVSRTTLGDIQQQCSIINFTSNDITSSSGIHGTIPSNTEFKLVLYFDSMSMYPWLWAIAFMMMASEVTGIIISLQKVCSTKQNKVGQYKHLAIIATVETLHLLASGVLIYVIMPQLSGVTCLTLSNCLATIPALIKLIWKSKLFKSCIPIFLPVLILLCQLFGAFAAFGPWSVSSPIITCVVLFVCLVLGSLSYWSNFVPTGTNMPYWLCNVVKCYRRNTRRPYIQLIICTSKLALIFFIMLMGAVANGTQNTFMNLFRFSDWSSPNFAVRAYGEQNHNATVACDPKYSTNFAPDLCPQLCYSSCLDFKTPCANTVTDTQCMGYCNATCQACSSQWMPTTTTIAVLTTAPAIISSNEGFASPVEDDFSLLTCKSSVITGNNCSQTCSMANNSFATVSLVADCYVYNPPTAGHDVISGVWLTLLTQIGCSWLCYCVSVFACKIGIQTAAFAFTLTVVVPVTTVFTAAWMSFVDQSFFTFDFFPTLLFRTDETLNQASPVLFGLGIFFMVLWYLSFVAVTLHNWRPSEERLAKTWRLFSQPSYWSFAIDKSLMLSRRYNFVSEPKEDNSKTPDPLDEELKVREPSVINMQIDSDESTKCYPKIYVCGTLWHEEAEEMKCLLTSILRLNHDQNLRKLIHEPDFRKDYIHLLKDIDDKDYYEVEFDLIFDDAFMKYDEEEVGIRPEVLTMNTYVEKWCQVVEELLTELNGDGRVAKPKKYDTPYGGRLVWKLQGGNIMNVHLKNKQEVRHKKRWSQVMYMFYILDFQMKQNYGNDSEALQEQMKNTYLLTLDGDVDFKPLAVSRLVDLMKKNDQVGSVCGRIHPLGSGPMIWYQMFEYAVGHWFQKAAEHVFGCVLCSPGCFALFRGAAVAQAMETYSKVSETAMDYLQHDQGEDRWLCTLLLQYGWRIEYCAASDAKTFAPEELTVFFNQRKRWTPSTLANQIDLLDSWRSVIKQNPSMSFGFMVYQMFMMVCTVIGTGSIFLMLFGSLSTIFNWPIVTSLFINLLVVIAYSLVCYFCKEKTQLQVTSLLSLLYGLLMVAVLVAICIQGVEEGPSSPNTLFLIIMVLCFVIGGLCHPQELLCLAPGIIYFAAIPCTYMLLNIYTVCNCNNVSWGTREAPNANAQLAQLKLQKEEVSIVQSTMYRYAEWVGTLWAKFCCRKDKAQFDDNRLASMENENNEIRRQLNDLTKAVEKFAAQPQEKPKPERKLPRCNLTVLPPDGSSASSSSSPSPSLKKDDKMKKVVNPELVIGKRYAKALSADEQSFWENFVKTKLHALIEDKDKLKITKNQLFQLRSKVMVYFYLLNAFYILIIFLLQVNSELLSFSWPFTPCTWNYDKNKLLVSECKLDEAVHYVGQCCGNCNNLTAPFTPIDANSTLVDCTTEYLQTQICECLQIEPVTIVVIVFFLLLLVVQFVGLICHRFQTFMHVVSTTLFGENNENKITMPDLLQVVDIVTTVTPVVTIDEPTTVRFQPKGLRRVNIKRFASIPEESNGSQPTLSTDQATKPKKDKVNKDAPKSEYRSNFIPQSLEWLKTIDKYESFNKNKGGRMSRQMSVNRQSVYGPKLGSNEDSDEDDDVFRDPTEMFLQKTFGTRGPSISTFKEILQKQNQSRVSFNFNNNYAL